MLLRIVSSVMTEHLHFNKSIPGKNGNIDLFFLKMCSHYEANIIMQLMFWTLHRHDILELKDQTHTMAHILSYL